MSEFLNIADTVMRLARVAGADDADVVIAGGKELEARVRLGKLESLTEATPQMLGLRVFTEGRTALTYTSDFRESALATLINDVVEMARLSDRDPDAGLPEKEAWADRFTGDLELYDPQVAEMTTQQKIEAALKGEESGLQADSRITNSGGGYFGTYYGKRALVNSRGFQGEYQSSSATLGVEVMCDDADGKKQNGSWWSSNRFLAELETPDFIGKKAAAKAVQQLGARKVASGLFPVVWDQPVACSFVGIIARAVSGEALFRRSTFLLNDEGKQVASSLFNLTDNPLMPRRLASRPFDDEGVTPAAHDLFVNGIFQNFLCDTYTARKTGRRSTGNASRSIGGAPSVGTANLIVAPGTTTLEELIGNVENGLFLTTLLGFGENITTGDFSRGAAGIWIENGQLTYPVGEINVSGNLRNMLANISQLGNDATFHGSIYTPSFLLRELMVSGL